MEEIMKTTIQELLYTKTIQEANAFLSSCTDSKTLHIYAFNYNWTDGFLIPKTIIDNPNCSLSTALLVFYLSDGYRYLIDKNTITNLPEWLDFITYLYNRIITSDFISAPFEFIAPLSKIQLFKLKKVLSDDEQIFITTIDGLSLNISI